MTMHVGSPWAIALFLFVLGAEGLAGAAGTIPWTVASAFLVGTVWGLYLALIAIVLWRQSIAAWRQPYWA